MYIIAGLGNPGHRFENTRHNIGFITLDKIAERNDIKINKKKYKALVGEGSISGCKVILVKPHTYMNLSGDSLREVMDFYKEEFEHLLVIYDDIDIPTGSIRIRKNGSAGTHNGMRSIVRQFGNLPCGDDEGWNEGTLPAGCKRIYPNYIPSSRRKGEGIMSLKKQKFPYDLSPSASFRRWGFVGPLLGGVS